MAQVETNEGNGEDNELLEWLTTNRLLKAKQKFIEFEVTMDDMRQLEDELIQDFVINELKLTGMLASRTKKAIQKLKASSSAGANPPQKQIVHIILTKEEGDAINFINNKYNHISMYLNQLNQHINKLNNISKDNTNQINQFRKDVMNKLNLRMDELIHKSTKEINKKKQKINQHIKQVQIYQTTLHQAQTSHNKLLNDDTLNNTKRKIKILEINKDILQNIKMEKPTFNPMVSIQFNKQKIFNDISNYGNNIHSYPAPPIFGVKNITASSATIEFSELKALQCRIEINHDCDDEKKSNWQSLATFSNESTYLCSNLEHDTSYQIRGKYKNKCGWSKYSKTVSLKTKKQVIDSLIMTDDEKKILLLLIISSGKYIGNKYKLLYRASRDGWTAKDFHQKCDNKGKTVHVIHTDINNVFGGYTSKAWSSDRGASINYMSIFLVWCVSNFDFKISDGAQMNGVVSSFWLHEHIRWYNYVMNNCL